MLDELDVQFPVVAVLNALEVVYRQYWLHGDYKSNFQKHLTMINEFYEFQSILFEIVVAVWCPQS